MLRVVTSLTLLVLAACAGGDGDGGSTLSNTFTYTQTSSSGQALSGTPTLHPGGGATALSEARNTGVTGVAVELRINGDATAEFLDLALAENASGDTLSLSLDGGRIFDIATLAAGSLADGDYTGVLYDDITTSTTSLGTPEDFIFLSAFGTTGEFEVLFGAAGLQTPNANLPALMTSYAGELGLLVDNPTAQTVTFFEADLLADADFANGQLSGALQQNGGSVGSLTGQITGAEVLGTLTISNGVLDSGETLTQGNLDAVGVFFGTGADNLAGVAAGQGVSTTNGGQPEALVGGFELSR